MVYPIVVGRGKRLFEEGSDQKALKLVDSETFSTGVLYLTPTSRRKAEAIRGPGDLILALFLLYPPHVLEWKFSEVHIQDPA
jgi:hypothetical protein